MRFAISSNRTRGRQSHETQGFRQRLEIGLPCSTATTSFYPTGFAALQRPLQANPRLVVVYSAFDYLYEDGTRLFFPAFPASELWPALRYRSPILPSTATILRGALLDAGGFRKVFIEDWDLWFRLVRRHSAAAFQELPECLASLPPMGRQRNQ